MSKKLKQLKKRICAAGMVIAAAGVSVPAAIGALPVESVFAAGDVAINAASFPDANFRKFVSENIDKNGDGKLNEDEINGCKNIECTREEISDLTGIEYFTALEILACGYNNLSSLDVSRNKLLKLLDCAHNNLKSIDVNKNTALESFSCGGNSISSLDVSGATALERFWCYNNNLSSLDVSRNTALDGVSCDSQVRDVTVSNNEIALSAIDPSIKASNISNVKGAVLSGNKFTNITGNTVTYDYATGHNDTKMDVTLRVTHIAEIIEESVSIDKKLLVLDKVKSGKLTATVKPDNAVDKSVAWSSSDENIAKVDQNGNVTAVNHGIAKITAKIANGKTAECEVRVNFIDVTNAKDWYYKPVYWAAENGITTGTDGKFFPADSCTREQAVTFLWRMAGKPDPQSMVSKYSDVKDTKRYSYKAIMWGTEKGVITGTDGKFYSTGTCTREQIVTMIWRLAGKPEPKNMNSKFKDVTSKTRYSYKAVMWAAEKGITTGTNGLFYPTGQCKRREIVTFIYRYKN